MAGRYCAHCTSCAAEILPSLGAGLRDDLPELFARQTCVTTFGVARTFLGFPRLVLRSVSFLTQRCLMQRILCLSCFVLWFSSTAARAEEPVAKPDKKEQRKEEVVKATFLITGLHCPPCTRTVANSLQGVQGVKSVTVDWNSKNARIEYDEQIISAQRLSTAIAATPHMMGGNMQYGGWLALKVSDVKAEDSAAWDRIKAALGKVPGVKRVAIYKSRSGAGVEFDSKGEATSRKLVTALADAGFKASNF